MGRSQRKQRAQRADGVFGVETGLTSRWRIRSVTLIGCRGRRLLSRSEVCQQAAIRCAIWYVGCMSGVCVRGRRGSRDGNGHEVTT